MTEPTELHALQQEVAALRQEVASLQQGVQGLLEAWRTAQGMVRLIKWMGATATAITATWALIKMGFRL